MTGTSCVQGEWKEWGEETLWLGCGVFPTAGVFPCENATLKAGGCGVVLLNEVIPSW